MIATANSLCPYVGLQPYTEADREYFFGRERETRIIVSNLYAAPLTILYGASGVGKSSVLLAGVVPELRKAPRTAVVVFREWQGASFLDSLKSRCIAAVESALAKSFNADPALPLDELLGEAARALNGTVVLLLDQFEEYSLYHPDLAEAFDRELATAINREDVDAGFLIALREDGLSKLDRFRARIPNLLGNTVRLKHLDAAAAEAGIVKPIDVYNRKFPDASVTIQTGLVGAVVSEVRTGKVSLSKSAGTGHTEKTDDAIQVEAPFLQLVMTRLWSEEITQGSRTLRLSTFRQLGGAQQISQRHFDNVMGNLSPGEQAICAQFFDRLVTPGGAKIACRLDDLMSWAGNSPEVPAVVKKLADSRVLRSVAGDEPQYEIFHDVLAPGILDWRTRYIEAQSRERATREAAQEAAEREIEAAREREMENVRALADVEKRRAEQQTKAAGRLRAMVGSLAVVFVIALGAAGVAWKKAEEAEAERKEADAEREKALEAQELASTQAMRARNLADQAREANALARERLDRIVSGIGLKQAFLGSDTAKIEAATTEYAMNSKIRFTATAKTRGYKNSQGRTVYLFEIFPEPNAPLKGVAAITYRMDHPTFKNALYGAGPDRDFIVSYDGWGCLRRVRAIIEYAAPDRPPEIASFDMCEALGWT